MINNLFFYATKELSQDAFICWLCSFDLRNSDSNDNVLRDCAHHFISSMLFGETIIEKEQENCFYLDKIEKQVGNIDVLLTVVSNGEVYKIIIEDKTYSAEHDNQLERYKQNVKTLKNAELYQPVKVIGIYYKTGFQSSYKNVRKAGYKIFDRKKILELLAPYVEETDNQIFRDYYSYWNNFERLSLEYKEKDFADWSWQTVNGFFNHIQNVIEENSDMWCGYDWVQNKSGGFWGLWYGLNDDYIEKDGIKGELYLQVEIRWDEGLNRYYYKNCLKFNKASGNDADYTILQESVRDEMLKCGFEEPKRIGHGKHITIGVFGDESIVSYNDIEKDILDSFEKYKIVISTIQLN